MPNDLKILLAETPNDPELLDRDAQILVSNGKEKRPVSNSTGPLKCAHPDRHVFSPGERSLPRLDRKGSGQVMHDMVYKKVKVKDKAPSKTERRSRAINAKSPLAHRNYAYYLREHEKFDEALIEANHIWKRFPRTPWACGWPMLLPVTRGTTRQRRTTSTRGIKADKTDRAMYW